MDAPSPYQPSQPRIVNLIDTRVDLTENHHEDQLGRDHDGEHVHQDGVFDMDMDVHQVQCEDTQYHLLVCGPSRSGKTTMVHTLLESDTVLSEMMKDDRMPPVPVQYYSCEDGSYHLEIHLVDAHRWSKYEDGILKRVVDNYVHHHDERFDKISLFAQHDIHTRILAQMYSQIDDNHVDAIARLVDMVRSPFHTNMNDHDVCDESSSNSDLCFTRSVHFAQELRDYVHAHQWPASMDIRKYHWLEKYTFNHLTLQQLRVLMIIYVTCVLSSRDIYLKLILQHALNHAHVDMDFLFGVWRRINLYDAQVLMVDDMNLEQRQWYDQGVMMIEEAHHLSQRFTHEANPMSNNDMFSSITCLWPLISHLTIGGPMKLERPWLLTDMPAKTLHQGTFTRQVNTVKQDKKHDLVHAMYCCREYKPDSFESFERVAMLVGWRHVDWIWTCVDNDPDLVRFDHIKDMKTRIHQEYHRASSDILDHVKFISTSSLAHHATKLKTMIAVKIHLNSSKLHARIKHDSCRHTLISYLGRLSGIKALSDRLMAITAKAMIKHPSSTTVDRETTPSHPPNLRPKLATRRRLVFELEDEPVQDSIPCE